MVYDLTQYGTGTWGSLANACFFLCAVYSDILLIRFWLVLAYVFFLISAFLGLPSDTWGAAWDATGGLSFLPWGMVFWSCLCGSFHLMAFLKLLWEERPIKLTGDAEQLWRCFYRRSGMGKLEFLELLKRGTWNRYKAGETIYLKGFSEICLHVVMEGVVECCLTDSRNDYWSLYSGEMFDYRLFNLFGIFIGFDAVADSKKGDGSIYQVNARTDCLVFTWHAQQVSEMAFGVSPSVAGFWRNLVLHSIGTGYTRRGRHNKGRKGCDSNGEVEDHEWYQGARTRDMTRPLDPSESDSKGFMAWVLWLWRTLSPFPPLGIRHTTFPRSGMRAAARILAFADQDHIIARFNRDINVNGRTASTLILTPRHDVGQDTSAASGRAYRANGIQEEDEQAGVHEPKGSPITAKPPVLPAPMNVLTESPSSWPGWITGPPTRVARKLTALLNQPSTSLPGREESGLRTPRASQELSADIVAAAMGPGSV